MEKSIVCPGCKTVFAITPVMVGKKFRCKLCSSIISIAQDFFKEESLRYKSDEVFTKNNDANDSNKNNGAKVVLVLNKEMVQRIGKFLAVFVFVIFGAILFIGNFHIITGGNVGGFSIASRDSFSFREFLVNVDEITGMPFIAAKAQHPFGVKVLQRTGLIESEDAFKKRVERETKEKMDKAMQESKRQFEENWNKSIQDSQKKFDSIFKK